MVVGICSLDTFNALLRSFNLIALFRCFFNFIQVSIYIDPKRQTCGSKKKNRFFLCSVLQRVLSTTVLTRTDFRNHGVEHDSLYNPGPFAFFDLG